jgi:hypothetical protein
MSLTGSTGGTGAEVSFVRRVIADGIDTSFTHALRKLYKRIANIFLKATKKRINNS